MHRKMFLLLILFLWALTLKAQSPEYFSALSSEYYKTDIEERKKFKSEKKFKEKLAQEYYEDFVTTRNNSILDDLQYDEIIHDSVLLEKCHSIFQRIQDANPDHTFDNIKFYIHRSFVPNAATYGEGTIMINLGLFLIAETDDELAFVLGHELAHHLMGHSDKQMNERITRYTSEDFLDELKRIRKRKTERYSRLKKLVLDAFMSEGRHSRFKETDADTLSALLVQKAGYNLDNGAASLLKLDRISDWFREKDLYNLRASFELSGIPEKYFNLANTRYKGLSKVTIETEQTAEADSLKTHPDCKARFKKLTGTDAPENIDCCKKLSIRNKALQERALFEIVRYLYENKNLSLAIHFSLMAINSGYPEHIYNRFIALSLSNLYHQDKYLNRFSCVDAKAPANSSLKELQDILFQLKADEIAQLALYYLNKLGDDLEDDAFSRMQYNLLVKSATKPTPNDPALQNFENNKYTYILKKHLK